LGAWGTFGRKEKVEKKSGEGSKTIHQEGGGKRDFICKEGQNYNKPRQKVKENAGKKIRGRDLRERKTIMRSDYRGKRSTKKGTEGSRQEKRQRN